MISLKAKAITQINAQVLVRFFILAGVATLLPFYVHTQWLTGPIINAVLILTLFLVGIRAALILCLVPSMVALGSGLLPAILAPIVPFIMMGNALLVLAVDWFYNNLLDSNRGYFLGLFTGALIKFLFLYSSVIIISRLLIKQELALKVAQIMSWPQLATAVIGGVIAYLFLKKLKKI
ncbi:ECF transporter S component [Candidatus Falkowbacteria bacterium]|nr:ECF transporter S component [Candidatus Falkowbacteria bacterium]